MIRGRRRGGRRRLVLAAGAVFALVAFAGAATPSSPAAGSAVQGSTAGAAALASNPWIGSGPGTTNVVSDGTDGVAQFTYAYEAECCASGTWTFSTTADTSGSVELNWSYTGFHAYFMVTVGLSAFVTGDGTTTSQLVNTGPASCCTSPSAGFTYSGTTTLVVNEGDTYGFTMSGTNFDSDGRLQGTLTVTTETPAPVLFGAVPDAQPGFLGVSGLIDGGGVPEGTQYDVSIYAAGSCDDSEPSFRGTRTIETNANGIAAFAIDNFSAVDEGQWVTATARRNEGDASPRSNCVRVGPNNTSWPTALPLTPTATTDGTLQTQGEGRWFKVPILPNSRVNIGLSGLPADYDLIVFNDIQQAYDALSEGANPTSGPGLALDDLAKQGAETPSDVFNTSQYNPSSWDPTNWDPALNSAGFSPSQWSPSQWSPSQWSASQWSPSQWSPSQWSPSQWSPSQWSPSQWSGTEQWSPSQWSSSFPSDPQLFSSAQTASLLAVSAGTGTGAESVSVNTWNNTGFFYIRVQGKNGSFDPDQEFTLSVEREGNICQGVADQSSSPTAPAGSKRTVILTDRSRMTIDPTLDGKLTAFAGRPEVNGVVVDVNGDPAVQALNQQADSRTGCPYAKNLVASATKRIVDAYRETNPIEYVVVVGDDSVIPFFRYADPSLLGNETMYSPPVLDNSPSQASLRLGYVLNQDGYGSSDEVTLHGNKFPIPDLAVGRLVETPAEIGGLLDAYAGLSGGVVPTPTRSLVTGYDFMQDAADSVASDLAEGIGGTANATLITNQSVAPGLVTVNGSPDRDHSWTAADLRQRLFSSGRHDLVFLAGHFSANDALAADYATNVLSTELSASTTDFVNSIVFSIGCHSGYNIVNGDAIPNVTEPVDWAQAFARKKATLIAGTGYQYGDTDFLAFSERVYTEFARQLRVTTDPQGGRVPVSVGNALLRSKRIYLKTTPSLSALDEKALLEATLFGLPMLSVDLPNGRIYEAPDATSISALTPAAGDPGASLGLRFADTTVGNTGITEKSLQLKYGSVDVPATYLEGPDGVVVVPTQPILPLVSRNVTAPTAGHILRGLGFRGGSYVDTNGVTPLTAAPATELRGIHAPFFTDVLFPVQPWTVNFFDAIGGSGVTRLMVTPVQHKSKTDDPTQSTRRAFSGLDFRLFYSNELSAVALAAAPTITGVETSFDGTSRELTFRARVVGDVGAGIQGVWVTHTIPPPAGQTGGWQSLDLTRDPADPSLWAGSLVLAAGVDPGNVNFLVQAVNGIGRVTLDTNVGSYYRPGSIPGAPSAGTPPAATAMAFIVPVPPATVGFGESVEVTARLTTSAGAPLAGKSVRIGIGGAGIPDVTNANGEAKVTLRASLTPGTYEVTASFAGDEAHEPSSTERPFAIGKAPTTLSPFTAQLAVVTADGRTGVMTTLTSGAAAQPLGQQTVTFSLTGPSSRVYSTITDFLGRATLPARGLAPGTYNVIAAFAGDAAYTNTSRTGTLVVSPFTGFFSPVDNTPTLNIANAGSAIPVKFGLGGNRGLSIFQAGYPKAVKVTCGTAATDPLEEVSTATTSGLQYDTTSQRYTYTWKTPKSFAGSCYQLQLGLVDGSTRVANFKFK